MMDHSAVTSGYVATGDSTHVILHDDQSSGLHTLTHPPDTSLRTRAELESVCDLSDQVHTSVTD